MSKQDALSLAGKLTVAGLVVAAAGVVIQIVSGVIATIQNYRSRTSGIKGSPR